MGGGWGPQREEIEGLKMRTEEEFTQEVQARNKMRAEVGLPLVSVAEEVWKLSARVSYCGLSGISFPVSQSLHTRLFSAGQVHTIRITCWCSS